ncbi:MAG: beta-ketoacyl-[acyl-carrier-protein] synthase II [Verrucomicrobia bacterium]|nr:beta-ketoacyl-[acyl-carrier-protein] synthase II [Verrucomicrobiota bacterium]
MSTASQPRRVVVTGIGCLSALGPDTASFWDGLIKGRSGISRITRFDPTDFPSKVGAEIRDFDPGKFMDPKEAKRNDRYTQYAVAASRMAIEDAKVDTTKLDADRFGVIIGSGIGGMETIENQARVLIERGPSRVSPFTIPSLIANIASGVVAIEFKAKSVNYGVVSACASGSHALGEAMRHIRDGHADIMLSGGSEAAITRLGYAGFCNMKAMSTDFNDTPEKASRPFDKLRDGFVMGEGAGVLVIESLEHAQARGARIYCELAGYGATCDAYHITGQDQEGKGLALCLNRALSEAGIAKSEVSYINAHGTSTPINDRCETLAIKRVFGEQAPKIAISSTKSMTGHLLGAAGGVEAAVCALAIHHGVVPPTMNLENPDPDCDLDYVPNQARKMQVNVAISNNLGFGGHNASLVFKALK